MPNDHKATTETAESGRNATDRERREALRWVVFCAMYPGEENLFDNRSTSELRSMNSRAAGIADALVIAGARIETDDTTGTRVGFRYQDGEVLSPEREAQSEDDEIPVAVIDLGDGEWLTLADLRAGHAERLEQALEAWE